MLVGWISADSKGATVARAGKVSDATAGVEGLSIDESKGSDDEDEGQAVGWK